MAPLADWQIETLARQGMIDPFIPKKVGIVSHGLEADGYDVRASNIWETICDSNVPIDPREASEDDLVRTVADEFVLQPQSFVLARTVERFVLPNTISGLVVGKSRLARLGIIISPTSLKRGWSGETLIIEVSNQSNRACILRAGDGIGSILFWRGEPARIGYQGVFQNQKGTW